MERCIACGICSEKCPKKVNDEFNLGLSRRKAVFVKYSQAVPLKYAIDDINCIYFKKGKCRACEKFCPADAIKFDDRKKEMDLHVGAVVFTTGFEPYDPKILDNYGYDQHPNVVTSLEFERMLSASGPFQGHLMRPSDKETPRKIAWLQCVGSRDTHPGANTYCSAVCCTYAVKEAVMAMEHVPGLDTAVFYIDMRTHGKDFERYFNRAKEQSGVRFIKSRVPSLKSIDHDGRLQIDYLDEAGIRQAENFDIVVLSIGMCISQESVAQAQMLGVKLDNNGFPDTSSFEPLESARPGILICGSSQSPQDIPSSVVGASAAAGQIGGLLNESRWSLTTTKELPSETDIRGVSPRIGVFICHCGNNIAGVVDIPKAVAYARTLPFVAFVTDQLFACSQDSQEELAKIIREEKLNRIVVAACTPRTHEEIFRETVLSAGMNKYLFEMANIRNQCSWVHSDVPEAATEKAIDLIRMSVARAAQLQPLPEYELEINRDALVVGGGLAGLSTAKTLADQGFMTHVIERGDTLGGQAWKLSQTWKGEDVRENITRLIQEVESHDLISTYMAAEVNQVEGSLGQFKTTISEAGEERSIEHGAVVIATGALEFKPENYLYGQNPGVLTGLDLDQRLLDHPASLDDVKTAVFIQCVGSRIPERPYCSKVCCTHSVTNALKLLEINPAMEIYILYRDIRTYGLREELYRKAREKGIIFIRYEIERGLSVEEDESRLKVLFMNYILDRKMELWPDMLILATAIVPPEGSDIVKMFKVPIDNDGFFQEAHAKLRPVEFPTDGIFVCGLAHGPKPVDESITQAKAAAAKAVNVLSAPITKIGGVVAGVDESLCTGCSLCVQVCPFEAIKLGADDKAVVNEALCKGCGLCSASCRSDAPLLKGFDNNTILAQINTC